MDAAQALNNLIAALSGDSLTETGVYIGSRRQHQIVLESCEVLKAFVAEHTAPPEPTNRDS